MEEVKRIQRKVWIPRELLDGFDQIDYNFLS